MVRSLFLVFSLLGSLSVQANETSIKFAKGYLEEVLVRSYDNIEDFIDVSSFTKHHELTLSKLIDSRFSKELTNEEAKKNFKGVFIKMGIPEEELSEWTVGDLVKYFFVDYYQVHSNSLQGATTENINYLSTVKDEGLIHYLFNVEQSIDIGEEHPFKQKFKELRTVTIKLENGKPIIVPPNSLKAHVEVILHGLVEVEWEGANKAIKSES